MPPAKSQSVPKSEEGKSKYVVPYHGPTGAFGFVQQVAKYFFKHYHNGAWVGFCIGPILANIKGIGLADFFLVYTGQVPGLSWQKALYEFAKIELASVSFTYVYDWYNDYHDVENDAIDHPERPLPSGKMSKPQALTMISIWFVIHLCSLTQLCREAQCFFLVCNVLGFLYDDDNNPLRNYFRRSLWGRTLCFCVAAIAWQYAKQAHYRPFVLEAAGLPADVFPSHTWVYLSGIPDFFAYLVRLMLKDFVGKEGDAAGGNATFATTMAFSNYLTVFFVAVILHRGLNIWLWLAGGFGSYHVVVDYLIGGFDAYILVKAVANLFLIVVKREDFADAESKEAKALKESLYKGILSATNPWAKRLSLANPHSHAVLWNRLK